MNTGRACFNKGFSQFKGMQWAAEACLSICHNRHQPVDRMIFFGVVDLSGAKQGVVDAAYEGWDAVGRVEILIRIHLTSQVGVGSHLPATDIDGLKAGFDLLHSLVTGQGAEGGHVGFGM